MFRNTDHPNTITTVYLWHEATNFNKQTIFFTYYFIFSDADPFVQVDFTIEFADTLDVGVTQDFISRTIFDDKPRVRVDVGADSYLGNIVGDVAVYYDSLLDNTDIVYGMSALNKLCCKKTSL